MFYTIYTWANTAEGFEKIEIFEMSEGSWEMNNFPRLFQICILHFYM